MGFSAGTFGSGSNIVANDMTGPAFRRFADRTDLDAVAYWTLQNLGVGNLAIIRGARSRLRQSELRELETLNRIRTEVAEAYARVHARYSQIETLETAVRVSVQAFDEDFKRVRGREGLPIEALDSARLLTRSRNDYLDVIIGYNEAQFQLYAALGRPPAGALARPVPAELLPRGEGIEKLPAPAVVPAKP